MTRDPSHDTQPMATSADATDPGGPPESVREEPTATLAEPTPEESTPEERERMEQLIQAFNRPPQRPSPNYTERAHSEGGNAVGYSGMMAPAPALHEGDQRERVLLKLGELAQRARHAPDSAPRRSRGGRDVTTVSLGREGRRGRMWLALCAAVALAAIGIAAVHASAPTPGAPPAQASGAPSNNAAPATGLSTAPSGIAPPGPASTPPPSPNVPPAVQAPSTAFSGPAPGPSAQVPPLVRHVRPATPVRPMSSAKPGDDPTLDELDRAP